MALDIEHQWGGDLSASSSGDLAGATGSAAITQRLLRRLLTNPNDYIWNLDYGAGLPKFVGTPSRSVEIEAIVRAQIMLEPTIARLPEPTIGISEPALTDMRSFQVDIQFSEASTGMQSRLSAPVSG